ncbi:class I SAM-dependent methyltransferase [Allochromatium palmeri]|uniref:SAM-dependent methyltransferase n=1 Tax=Allochromatium palmeri TaxID=231048 RepID=A0A6N8EGB5_9GAMM|nr:SAM-dependent methyltransferase [Allochromatium palmeri]MTW21879.1 SAM-dependent methyltransferase [Allochromatium palmeri]
MTDHATDISRRLEDRIRAEIRARGSVLPFDRFMELALYAPGLGYYVAGAPKFGPGGDFVTAPELSPLFGRCLAVQCAEVLERLDGGEILEFGAGSGALAVQILLELEALERLPKRYRILEPSPDLQERQRAAIQTAAPHLLARCDWLTTLPECFAGVVIANEVLDAMPVHRFRIGTDGEILEIGVTEADGRLVEVAVPPISPGLIETVSTLQAAGLADAPGYESEINLRLAPWLAALSSTLERGLALLIDYGYPRAEYYQPERHMGTLRCHHRHQAHSDPYVQLGLQDITAHVDFTAVAEASVAAGFEPAGFTTQAHFLIGCGIDRLMQAVAPEAALDQALGAKQLLLPTAMGERFKVLGLAKGVDGPWSGFAMRDLSDRL